MGSRSLAPRLDSREPGSLEASPESLLSIKTEDLPVQLVRSDSHHGNFLEAIRSRRPLAAPVDASVRSDTLYHLDQIAIKLRRKLRWDPIGETFVDDAEANRMLDRPMRAPWKLPA